MPTQSHSYVDSPSCPLGFTATGRENPTPVWSLGGRGQRWQVCALSTEHVDTGRDLLGETSVAPQGFRAIVEATGFSAGSDLHASCLSQ